MKIAIIGFGASGLYAALELKDSTHEVDIYDVGPEFSERKPCPVSEGKLQKCPVSGCNYCPIYKSGGLYNDGKILANASPMIGGNLYDLIGERDLTNHIAKVIKTFQDHGADNPIVKPSEDDIRWISSKATLAGMIYGNQELLHVGSDRLPLVVCNIFENIKNRYNYIWESEVIEITYYNSKFQVMFKLGSLGGCQEEYDAIIIAGGRSGSKWLTNSIIFKDFQTEAGQVDVGVRFEISNEIMQEVNNKFYEIKLYYKTPTFGDIVRSFCQNPSGFVCRENNGDFSIVNGHAKRDIKSRNTNLALLVSKHFTEPFKAPVKYANAIASLANMLGGGPLVQRLGDLKKGRRTKSLKYNSIKPTLDVECGDLSLALPYRILKSILEFIEAMDKVTPGVNCEDALLYGVEAKYFTDKIKVSPNMEALPNCFVIGDISGHTRGISQSCVSGILAAQKLKLL